MRDQQAFFRPVASVLAAAALAACDPSVAGDRPGLDEPGIEPFNGPVVANDADAMAEARPLILREVLRIGSVEGPAEYQFGAIGAVRQGRDGEIHVVDRQAQAVRIYDRGGRFLRQVGREGDGPGEFRGPQQLALAGDSALVLDSQGGADLFVRGEPIASVTPSAPDEYLSAIGRGPAGWLAGTRIRAFADPSLARDQNEPLRDEALIGTVAPASSGLEIRDTVLRVRLDTYWLVGTLGWIMSPLFARSSEPIFGRDGRIYHAPGDAYVIDVLDASGAPYRRVTADVPKIPVTRGDVDDYLRRERAERGPSPSGETARWLQEVPPALQKAPLLPFRPIPGRILAAESGRMMVERLDLGPGIDTWQSDSTWDLFDSTGRIVGRFDLAAAVRPSELTDELLWAVVRDELDVQYVVGFAIE